MKKKITKYSLIIIFLITLYSLIPVPLSAQQISLSISPPILEAVIKPGKSIMVAYDLKNFGDPTIIEVKTVSFEPKNNLGQINLKSEIEGPIRFYLDNSLIKLEQPFFLKTGESQQLLLRIKVPENAENGDYYYSLTATTIPPTTLEGVASSQAKMTIASNILITVTDSGIIEVKPKIVLFEPISKLKINLFGKQIKIFDSFDPIPIVLLVENKGKNLIKPEGAINLSGIFGASSQYQIVTKNILSQSQRLIEATPSSDLTSDNHSLLLKGFHLGRYSLSTNITFGENSPMIFASNSFLALPIKMGVIVFGLVILLIVFLRRFSDYD